MSTEKNAESPTTLRTSRRVQSVDHAIDVLEAIAAAGRPIGVSDVSRRTNLSKATVHHLLATLEARRFVIREFESRLYRLSWALYELGSNVVREVDLSRVARPFLDRLALETGESVLLGILDGETVLYLDRGEPLAGLRMRANAGRRGVLHATASGKILLAFSSNRKLVDRVLSGELPKLTKTTITDSKTLKNELDGARKRGYAACWEEREVGLCSLAVPLRNYSGEVVGSLALAAPATRLTIHTLPPHLKRLKETAVEIEQHLGADNLVTHE